ncbi:MAG: hypothetical protein H7249_00015 [Chitinophagaceae bacterium]|nr:hypothetical protein [Oligoflexus sp.]
MDRSEAVKKIIGLLEEEFPTLSDMDLKADTALLSSGLLDSFAMVTVLSLVESAFGVSVDVNTLELSLFESPATISEVAIDKKYHKA